VFSYLIRAGILIQNLPLSHEAQVRADNFQSSVLRIVFLLNRPSKVSYVVSHWLPLRPFNRDTVCRDSDVLSRCRQTAPNNPPSFHSVSLPIHYSLIIIQLRVEIAQSVLRQAGRSGFNSRQYKNFLFSTSPRPTLGSTQWVPRALSLEV
jgi:hypothetical protein